MRAQKDTQEAFMRYTSYREIEQQARLAVTNAEKRRDDISKQWKPLTMILLIPLIVAIILAQNQMPMGLWNAFPFRYKLRTFLSQMSDQEGRQFQQTIDIALQGILWRY